MFKIFETTTLFEEIIRGMVRFANCTGNNIRDFPRRYFNEFMKRHELFASNTNVERPRNKEIKKTVWVGKLEGNEEEFPPGFSLLYIVNINNSVQQTEELILRHD